MMLKKPELFQNGFHLSFFSIEEVRPLVLAKDWAALDQKVIELTRPGGKLFTFLKTFHDFTDIEFIISLRNASNDWEEDGIWHDDGSRVFAFSLSLTMDSEKIEGGRLGVRRKG